MFSQLLLDGMRKQHVTVQGVAMMLNMDKSTVSRKINGRTGVSVVEAMDYASKLGIQDVCSYCPVACRNGQKKEPVRTGRL